MTRIGSVIALLASCATPQSPAPRSAADEPTTAQGDAVGGSSELPTLSLDEPVVMGPYDAAIARRYIKRNILKLQDCYEKQLVATPGLAGTISAEFTIGTEGKVTASAASGVHEEVAACMKLAIATIEFPKPKLSADGTTGEVTVIYSIKVGVQPDPTAPK